VPPLLVLAWLFTPALDLTASPRFADRETGSALLEYFWPLTEPTLAIGRSSMDAEVRARCRRATPTGYLEVRRVLATNAGRRAFRLLVHPFEADGVPVADPDLVGREIVRDEVRSALGVLARRLGLLRPGEESEFDEVRFDPFVAGEPTCIVDRLRYRIRGLDDLRPCEDPRPRWNELKPLWAAWK
jgi:hypothetical protein